MPASPKPPANLGEALATLWAAVVEASLRWGEAAFHALLPLVMAGLAFYLIITVLTDDKKERREREH